METPDMIKPWIYANKLLTEYNPSKKIKICEMALKSIPGPPDTFETKPSNTFVVA